MSMMQLVVLESMANRSPVNVPHVIPLLVMNAVFKIRIVVSVNVIIILLVVHIPIAIQAVPMEETRHQVV